MNVPNSISNHPIIIPLVTAGLLFCLSAEGTSSIRLFSRGIMENGWAEPKPPGPDERISEAKIIALRGEYEPIAFQVLSDSAGECSVKATDLAARSFAIPASEIEISLLQRAPDRQYRAKDWMLEPGCTTFEVRPNSAARLWITVHVPEKTPPGLYKGKVIIGGAGNASLVISLEVLPFDLEPVPEIDFSLLSTSCPKGMDRKKFYRMLKEHGMTSLCTRSRDYPYRAGNFSSLIEDIDAAVAVGLDGPVVWNVKMLLNTAKPPPGKHFDGPLTDYQAEDSISRLKDLVPKVREECGKRGWPEVIWYVIDEPDTLWYRKDMKFKGMEVLMTMAKETQALGSRAASTITDCCYNLYNDPGRGYVKERDYMRKLWDAARPYVALRIYGYGYQQAPTDLFHELKDARKRGHKAWVYNNVAIMGSTRKIARTYYGLWGWKIGVDGLTAWTYPGMRTVQFEIVREGIDDRKYIALLERLAADPKTDPNGRAAAAGFLKQLRDSIKLDRNGWIGSWRDVAGNQSAQRSEVPWPDVNFSDMKKQMARILKMCGGVNSQPIKLQGRAAGPFARILAELKDEKEQTQNATLEDEVVEKLLGEARRFLVEHAVGTTVKLDFYGRVMKGKVTGCDLDDGLELEIEDEILAKEWEEISAAETAGLLAGTAEAADEPIPRAEAVAGLLFFAAGNREKAAEYLDSAMGADKELEGFAKENLAALLKK